MALAHPTNTFSFSSSYDSVIVLLHFYHTGIYITSSPPLSPPQLSLPLPPRHAPGPPPPLSHFLAWLASEGVVLSPDVVIGPEPNTYSPPAWAIRTRRALPAETTLCSLPKRACLSVRTTSIAHVITTYDLDELEGVGLTAAVMVETARGAQSRFYPYLASMPRYGRHSGG